MNFSSSLRPVLVPFRAAAVARARFHFRRYPPVFIVGAPRSGTTLLLQILGSQPYLTPNFEPREIWSEALGPCEDDTYAGRLTPSGIRRLLRLYYRHLQPGRPTLLTKDPCDSLRIGLIRRVFPNARFLHIVRDPRDVIASTLKTQQQAMYRPEPGRDWVHVRIPGYTRLLDRPGHIKAAAMWSCCVESVVRGLAAMSPHDQLTVRYEDLVQAARSESDRILRFLHGPYDHSALEGVLHLVSPQVRRRTAADNGPAAGGQGPVVGGFGTAWVRSDVLDDAGSGTTSTSCRIAKWRDELDPQALRECEEIIGPLQGRFGYA
jgi:hypothetical protein